MKNSYGLNVEDMDTLWELLYDSFKINKQQVVLDSLWIYGSRLTGLHNEDSDWDVRGIYLDTDPTKIFGYHEPKAIITQLEGSRFDVVFHDIKDFIRKLVKTNSQFIEAIYAPDDAFIERGFGMAYLRENKEAFIDPHHLFKSLRGYLQGERRLALGERPGRLGGKRRASLEKYGYSPKNFVQMFRLCYCGITFFKTGDYPVDLRNRRTEYDHDMWMSIKNSPENYPPDKLVTLAEAMEEDLVKAYKTSTIFDRFSLEPDIGAALKRVYRIK